MKQYNVFFLIAILLGSLTYAQVGVGTEDPKTTLQVVGEPADANVLDGVQAPQLTGDQLRAKTYTGDQTGALVYVTAADTAPAGQTVNVTASGYYYFDGAVWQMLTAGSALTGSPWTDTKGTPFTSDDTPATDATTQGIYITQVPNFGFGTLNVAVNGNDYFTINKPNTRGQALVVNSDNVKTGGDNLAISASANANVEVTSSNTAIDLKANPLANIGADNKGINIEANPANTVVVTGDNYGMLLNANPLAGSTVKDNFGARIGAFMQGASSGGFNRGVQIDAQIQNTASGTIIGNRGLVVGTLVSSPTFTGINSAGDFTANVGSTAQSNIAMRLTANPSGTLTAENTGLWVSANPDGTVNGNNYTIRAHAGDAGLGTVNGKRFGMYQSSSGAVNGTIRNYFRDYVGIGTEDPTEQLEVEGGTKTNYIVLDTQAATIGDACTNNGEMLWNGTNFLGCAGGTWTQLD